MNKRFFTLLIAFVLAGTIVMAQIRQAEKLFKSYRYSLAIPYYLKIAQKAGDPDQVLAIERLADCYRFINDQLNAKAWYAKTVKYSNVDPINWFYYGQALRCAQEYDLAKEAYLKYAELVPSDPRGKEYAGFCSQVPIINEIPPSFEIKNEQKLNSKGSDFGPTLYNDGIIFVSDRRQNFMDGKKYDWTSFNYLDLFYSKPLYLDEFYQGMNDPKPFLEQFNQMYHDGPASFACHDSLVFLTRTEKGREKKDKDNFRTDKLKLFWSRNNGSWSRMQPFFLNSDEYSVGHPALAPDGKTLYFVSDMPGGKGGTDIYCCQWEGDKWGEPKNLGDVVNSFGNEMFPSLNGDELYFASDGLPGLGGLDIFRTKFVNGAWTKPENLAPPINSSFDDFSIVLTPQGKNGFFSSNRTGGIGNDDIYACKRTEKKTKPATKKEKEEEMVAKADSITVTGFVKNKETLNPMPKSVVFLLNTKTDKVTVFKTDSIGMFIAPLEKGVLYVAKTMKNNYMSDCIDFKFSTADTTHRFNTPRDLFLDSLEINKVFKVAKDQHYAIENIYYDFDKHYIRPDAEVELDKLVQIMKENPIVIELGSHTDSRGSKEYNLDLSQRRAESAVRYIVIQGIEPTRITAKGYGETQLTNRCSDGVPCSPEEHQANRRTEFKVTGFVNSDKQNTFDMNKFNDGDVIPVYMFDRNFFINCVQNKIPEGSKPSSSLGNTPSAIIASSKTAGSIQHSENKPEQVLSSPVGQETQPTNINSNESSTKAEDKPAIEISTLKKGTVVYKVQLLALSRSIAVNDPAFDGLHDIKMYEEDGLFKYTSGLFTSADEAHAYRDEIIRLGFKDAFMVVFANNTRIYEY